MDLDISNILGIVDRFLNFLGFPNNDGICEANSYDDFTYSSGMSIEEVERMRENSQSTLLH